MCIIRYKGHRVKRMQFVLNNVKTNVFIQYFVPKRGSNSILYIAKAKSYNNVMAIT